MYLVRGRAWIRRVHERRLRRSEVFSEVQEFMHASERTHDRLADKLCQVHKSVLRLTLFSDTSSRVKHEQQLEAGREYLELGGNGPAEAQYEALKADYLRRHESNNWNYEGANHG